LPALCKDLVVHVGAMIEDAKTLLRMEAVCREWRSHLITAEIILWKPILQAQFPWLKAVLEATPLEVPPSYRNVYRWQLRSHLSPPEPTDSRDAVRPAPKHTLDEFMLTLELHETGKPVQRTTSTGAWHSTRRLHIPANPDWVEPVAECEIVILVTWRLRTIKLYRGGLDCADEDEDYALCHGKALPYVSHAVRREIMPFATGFPEFNPSINMETGACLLKVMFPWCEDDDGAQWDHWDERDARLYFERGVPWKWAEQAA